MHKKRNQGRGIYVGAGETMTCDICGGEIYAGDKYFEMPDGQCVCADDRDCLEEWAKEYSCTHQGNPIAGLVIKI